MPNVWVFLRQYLTRYRTIEETTAICGFDIYSTVITRTEMSSAPWLFISFGRGYDLT